jgi:hypothetical protein
MRGVIMINPHESPDSLRTPGHFLWILLARTAALATLVLVVLLARAASSHEFVLSSSRSSVERGERFTLSLEVKAAGTPIHNLVAEPLLPLGFKIEQGASPKIPDLINTGSERVFQYVVKAPGQMDKWSTPAEEGRPERGYSTREPKSFVLNLSYSDEKDGLRREQVLKLTQRFTTSVYFYLLWGVAGLFIAHIIKTLAKEKSKAQGIPRNPKGILERLFATNIVNLLTTLFIGFAVLVILAREAIPALGWYDSFALGIILGMLGDENLLGKLKGS